MYFVDNPDTIFSTDELKKQIKDVNVPSKYDVNIFDNKYVIIKLLLLMTNKNELFKDKYNKYVSTIQNRNIETICYNNEDKGTDNTKTYINIFQINLYENKPYKYDYSPFTEIIEYIKQKNLNINEMKLKDILLIKYDFKIFVKCYK
jgi:hypothetical protein